MFARERVRACRAGGPWAAGGQFGGGERCRSARPGCLGPVVGSAIMPTEKARLVNIKTSSEPPRKDPSWARCRAVSYLRSHPPSRHLPRQRQPTKALSAHPSAEAQGRGPKQHLRSAL